MSLFIVNRYDEFSEDRGECQENIEIEKLKGKIEERKKARLQEDEKFRHSEKIQATEKDFKCVVSVDVYEDNKQSRHSINNDNLNLTKFKVLGTGEFEKTLKVKRVLPYWLMNPSPISLDLKQQLVTTDNIHFLESSLKKKMIQQGLKYLFPVQAQVIPWLLQQNTKSHTFWPRDLCVSAPTGSGKTLTYVLPIIQMLTERVERQIRALVIVPVKELVLQVGKVFRDYCVGTNLKVVLLTGSISFIQEQLHIAKYCEMSGWQSEADIVVCTAGRLVEHLRLTKGFSLKHLQFLVIDEADRIMDHIQNDWLHHLNRHLQMEDSIMNKNVSAIVNSKTLSNSCRPPQKLLFSATLSQDPEQLKQWNLFQPKLFSVTHTGNDRSELNINKFTTPLELSEKYTISSSDNKPLVLYHILKSQNCKRVLCFTNSSQAAHRLTVLLSYLLKDIRVGKLSAAMNRNCRETVLKELLSGNLNMLISTDALARGIDVPNCDLVISYDPPKNAKTYIHRVGRTGRAGREGKAVTILLHNQYKPFQDIMKTIGKQDIDKFEVPQEMFEEFSQQYKDAIESLGHKLNDESQTYNHNLKMLKRGRILHKSQTEYQQKTL